MGLKDNIIFQGIDINLAKSKRSTLFSSICHCVLKSFPNNLNSNWKEDYLENNCFLEILLLIIIKQLYCPLYFTTRKWSDNFDNSFFLFSGLCNYPGPLRLSRSGSRHILPSAASYVCTTTCQSIQSGSQPLCKYEALSCIDLFRELQICLPKDQPGDQNKKICFLDGEIQGFSFSSHL